MSIVIKEMKQAIVEGSKALINEKYRRLDIAHYKGDHKEAEKLHREIGRLQKQIKELTV